MKVLTQKIVNDLGLDNVSVITADMLDGYTCIGDWAFYGCCSLNSITITNSVTSIGDWVFYKCSGLTSVTISNSTISIGRMTFYGFRDLVYVTIGCVEYKPKTVTKGKCKAYKAFNADMTCRGFQYKEDETYEFDGVSKLCIRGFHACLNFADIFNYYCGKIGQDIVVHEVELEGISNERRSDSSKVVANKITIGKRIL